MYKSRSTRGIDREHTFLSAPLDFYQDMPLQTPTNESNDIESYRTLEEVRRYSNKELKVNRELIERAIYPKEFTTVGKLKAFQFVSGVLGKSHSLFMDEEARDAYFVLK